MSSRRISINPKAITDLLGIIATVAGQPMIGAGIQQAGRAFDAFKEAKKSLESNGVDPAIWQKVLEDHRTFVDFHGKNHNSNSSLDVVEATTTDTTTQEDPNK